jgi:hypothetical protein
MVEGVIIARLNEMKLPYSRNMNDTLAKLDNNPSWPCFLAALRTIQVSRVKR